MSSSRAGPDRLERAVRPLRLVVEEHQAARTDRPAESDRIVDARVPPPDLRLVLLVEVLRVVQDDVGARGQRATRDPVRRPVGDPGQHGLVVGQVGEARRAGLDPVAERRPGVQDEVGAERDPVRFPALARQVMEPDLGRDVAEVEWEQRWRERPQDPLAQADHRRARPPDVEGHLGVPERREEPEALEVVEMEVGQEEVDSTRPAPGEVEAELADSGPGVQHQGRVVAERDLDAGRVAAVPDGLRPGRRHRAAASPDLHLRRHLVLVGSYVRQKITTAPTNSSVCAKSGNAVASSSRSTPSALVTM